MQTNKKTGLKHQNETPDFDPASQTVMSKTDKKITSSATNRKPSLKDESAIRNISVTENISSRSEGEEKINKHDHSAKTGKSKNIHC